MLVCKPAQHSRYRRKDEPVAGNCSLAQEKRLAENLQGNGGKYLMGAYIDLLKAAQSGDTAAATVLYEQYQPLIKKLSWHDGIFDMDLYQTLSVAFLVALSKFEIR